MSAPADAIIRANVSDGLQLEGGLPVAWRAAKLLLGVKPVERGSFGVPVLLVTGDEAVCAEANEWLPGVETVAVKKATGRHSAECLPAKVSQKKIHQGSFQAIRLFNENNVPEPLVMPSPVTITVEFIYSDMADRAALLPGVARPRVTRSGGSRGGQCARPSNGVTTRGGLQ